MQQMVTFLFLSRMPFDKTHLGTKYVVQGGGGLARFCTEALDEKASLRRFEGQVTFLVLAASLDAHVEVTHVTNVGEVSRSFSSQ